MTHLILPRRLRVMGVTTVYALLTETSLVIEDDLPIAVYMDKSDIHSLGINATGNI